MAGYTTGTIWDTVFVESYDAFDDAEVSVSGVPVYASLGWRRIGRMGLSMEAIAGATIILSQETYELGGNAPSVIPGFGVRVGFGFDTFFYSR